MAEEMAIAKAAKAEKAIATQVGIQHLARIEIAIEEKQVNAVAKKAKPVRPPPKGRPKAGKAISEREKSLSVVANDEAQGGLIESGALENNTDSIGLGDGPGKRRKKKGIRESINHARDKMINRTSHLDGGGDSKGPHSNKGSENTLVNPNFMLGGKVQNWISGVDKTLKPHELATRTSNSVPPSTIFTHLMENTEITIESATPDGTGGK
ncbi:hypothetical protein EV424DRAFT_1354326 [Suillus variegatus]|nr:hypothetical protein EV424DRAFT_1354326 [Suillus variegatus]